MENVGFIRAMSKKACSPDNAACEGLSLGGMSPLNYRKSLGLVA
jgi:hypothetical protein